MKIIISLITATIFLTSSTLKAQDLIVKNNKEEIKAKVLEVEESAIKYKKFDFQEGPTYSINKADIFMIIYQNGTRETFGQTKPTVPQASSTVPQVTSAAPEPASSVDAVIQPKLNLASVSVNLDGLGPEMFNLRVDYEIPFYKRYFYYGATIITSSSGSYSTSFGGFSASVSAPVSYLINKDDSKPYSGFRPFFKVYFLTDFEVFDTTFDAGVDWHLIKGRKGGAFGATVFTTEFSTINTGLSFTF